MTEADIEREARRLCIEAGAQPERRIPEYGQTSWTYPQWELYRESAIKSLETRRPEQLKTPPCYRCGMTFRIGKPEHHKNQWTICTEPQCNTRFSSGYDTGNNKAIVWVLE